MVHIFIFSVDFGVSPSTLLILLEAERDVQFKIALLEFILYFSHPLRHPLDKVRMARFLRRIEDGYSDSNPYHCR